MNEGWRDILTEFKKDKESIQEVRNLNRCREKYLWRKKYE